LSRKFPRQTVRVIRVQTMGRRSPDEPLERCELTGKRNFPTRRKAIAAFNHYVESNRLGEEWMDGDVYQCQCGAWHLTRGAGRDTGTRRFT